MQDNEHELSEACISSLRLPSEMLLSMRHDFTYSFVSKGNDYLDAFPVTRGKTARSRDASNPASLSGCVHQHACFQHLASVEDEWERTTEVSCDKNMML